MPYTCIEGCPLWVDRQMTRKTRWRVAPGTVIEVEESYPRGANLEVSMIKTLGLIDVYDKETPLILGRSDGWLDGKYFQRVVPPADAPGTPTFEEAGRALDTLVRFLKARL